MLKKNHLILFLFHRIPNYISNLWINYILHSQIFVKFQIHTMFSIYSFIYRCGHLGPHNICATWIKIIIIIIIHYSKKSIWKIKLRILTENIKLKHDYSYQFSNFSCRRTIQRSTAGELGRVATILQHTNEWVFCFMTIYIYIEFPWITVLYLIDVTWNV